MVSSPISNPFQLLMDPASVLRAVEASPALCGLNARVFRPLEMGGGHAAMDADLAAYDTELEIDDLDSEQPGA
jgi:hypothetical protein